MSDWTLASLEAALGMGEMVGVERGGIGGIVVVEWSKRQWNNIRIGCARVWLSCIVEIGWWPGGLGVSRCDMTGLNNGLDHLYPISTPWTTPSFHREAKYDYIL